MKQRRIALTDATPYELQAAARSVGGDEQGLLNIIEADDITPEEATELRDFLIRQHVTELTDDDGYIRARYYKLKQGN